MKDENVKVSAIVVRCGNECNPEINGTGSERSFYTKKKKKK